MRLRSAVLGDGEDGGGRESEEQMIRGAKVAVVDGLAWARAADETDIARSNVAIAAGAEGARLSGAEKFFHDQGGLRRGGRECERGGFVIGFVRVVMT